MAKRGLRSFLKRGVVASQGFIVTGASAVSASAASRTTGQSPYEVVVRTGGTAGNEVLNMPLNGDFIGQRLLITFGAEGNAADVVRINAAATGALAAEALALIGAAVTNFTGGPSGAAVTNVDLDTPGKYALFEYIGGATPAWNVVYTTGALS